MNRNVQHIQIILALVMPKSFKIVLVLIKLNSFVDFNNTIKGLITVTNIVIDLSNAYVVSYMD